jgi:hypothetical protein
MANVKISQLPGAGAALGTQEFEVNESGLSKKVTGSQLSNYVRGQVTLNDLGVTSTSSELNYTDGVTSAIQTQLDGKQPLDADLTAVAGLATSGLVARTGAGTAAARSIAVSGLATITNQTGASGNPTVGVPAASQAEAEAGTNNTKVMTPLRVAQAVEALGYSQPTAWGGIGTYALLGSPTSRGIVAGTSYAGSGLVFAGTRSTGTYSDNTAADILSGTTVSGTWKAMGTGSTGSSRFTMTLFLRIS